MLTLIIILLYLIIFCSAFTNEIPYLWVHINLRRIHLLSYSCVFAIVIHICIIPIISKVFISVSIFRVFEICTAWSDIIISVPP